MEGCLSRHKWLQVPLSVCLQLKKFIDRISQIFAEIESSRPRCSSGVQALSSLHFAMDKAKLLIQHSCESSKLYLAITAERILLRCERIRNTLVLCLSEIQNMVPALLAAKISGIVDDLKAATFTVDSCEEEAGNALLALLRQDMSGSDSINDCELKALQLAASKLHITSATALLIEKRSIKRLLERVHDADVTKRNILKYLLYLLRKYGETIKANQKESAFAPCEESIMSIELEVHSENAIDRTQIDASSIQEPPEDFKCPLSKKLMHDPVVIASGQTFERFCIEKWFSQGYETCPRTHMKLPHFSFTPNLFLKDLISQWCFKHNLTIPDPYVQEPFFPEIPTCSSSVASFGSSMKILRLQISNVSLRSSDTSSGSDLVLDIKVDDDYKYEHPLTNANYHRSRSSSGSHGIDLAFLIKLAALSWGSQCKAVKDVKDQLKEGNRACYSTTCIKTLIRFLKEARDLNNMEAQVNGIQVLLAFLSRNRNEIQQLHEDSIYLLASYLDSEIAEEALAIFEVLSSQPYYKSEILALGILPSVLNVLDRKSLDLCKLAMKILSNLSSNSDIVYHIVYLDCIPKLASFLADRGLAEWCLKIFRNLCNSEEARIAVAKNSLCIELISEVLVSGTKEEQEYAVDILLSLCNQSAEYCRLVMEEKTIQPLVDISVNGNARGKAIAMKLLQLLRDKNDQECSLSSGSFSHGSLGDLGDLSKKKSSSSKGLRYLGRKISKFFKQSM